MNDWMRPKKVKSKFRRIISKPMVLMNLLFAGLLIMSYITVHLSPETIPGIAIFGLSYPFVLFINFFFILYFSLRKKRYFLISIIAIAIGFNHLTDFFSIGSLKSDGSTKSTIKVLSYNVRMFDLYKWSNEKWARNKMLRLLKDEDPDVMCFQEFYSNNNSPGNNLDTIMQIQNTKNYIVSYKSKKNRSLGTAIFSKFPIVNSGNIELDDKNKKCIYADIVFDKDTVRFYSLHLASIQMGYDDYTFMENISEEDNSAKLKGFEGIFSKILHGFSIRAIEVDAVSAHIKNSPHRVIVCGDFNDVPTSYTYRKIRSKLKDAFEDAGFGTGNTYANKFSFFRIDFMLHSSDIKSFQFNTINEAYSDHYPITCSFEL